MFILVIHHITPSSTSHVKDVAFSSVWKCGAGDIHNHTQPIVLALALPFAMGLCLVNCLLLISIWPDRNMKVIPLSLIYLDQHMDSNLPEHAHNVAENSKCLQQPISERFKPLLESSWPECQFIKVKELQLNFSEDSNSTNQVLDASLCTQARKKYGHKEATDHRLCVSLHLLPGYLQGSGFVSHFIWPL